MPSQTPTSSLLRRVRSVMSLCAVGVVALPLIGWSNAVAVEVDGERLSTRTYAQTVGDVLDQLDVSVGSADEVSPSRHASIEDGTVIEVARAITVDIVVDGEHTHSVTAPFASVAGALTEAGMGDLRERGADINPGWTAPVSDGDVIQVALPRMVELAADGETQQVITLTTTVGAMLAEQGIDLRSYDEVDWDLTDELVSGTAVTVNRVDFDEVVVETVLPRGEVRRDTKDLRRGVTRVAEEGHDGLRRDTYRVRLVDGQEVEREHLDREVVREPKDRVVLVGTYVPPPPPPPSAPSDDVWDRLARCESGGNWQARGTYHGGLQFHPSTWTSYKLAGYPQYAYEASREQQIEVGKRVQRSQGWGAWPHCSRQLGLR